DVHVRQTNLEAHNVAHRVAGAGLREGVDRIRVDPPDADRQGRAVGGEVKRGVVERVGRVEVERLRVGARRRVALAPDVLQTGEGGVQADRIDAGSGLLRREGVRQRLDVRETVVSNRIRAGGADRAGDDGERAGHADVAGLHRGRVAQG